MKGFKEEDENVFPDTQKVPELMTEEELVQFLRIPYVSKSKDYSNVVKNLIRMRNLPRIQICNKILFPKKEVLGWISQEIIRN